MKHLLLVDDDPAILDVFGMIFSAPEYNVSVFSNPDAIFTLKTDIPDLIFLDTRLSGADGLEVCRRLKKGSLTRDIPIILISASPGIQQQAREAGAVAGIEKPFSIKELRLLVKTTLNKRGK